jgi:hypothetical protein
MTTKPGLFQASFSRTIWLTCEPVGATRDLRHHVGHHYRE